MCEWWKKGIAINDDPSDIIINEQSYIIKDNEKNDDNSIHASSDASENDNEVMKSGKNDENSIDAPSDKLDNDIEVMKSGFSAIYEAYFGNLLMNHWIKKSKSRFKQS